MMEWLKPIYLRLKKILRRRELERDLHDEMSFHLEMREEQLRSRGTIDPRSSAWQRFGNLTRLQEDCRETWTFAALERSLADIRYAGRALAKKPGFTTVAVLTLAIGIGANSAVFSAIDAVLLRPLPFPNGDQLMVLDEYRPKVQSSFNPVAPPRLRDWDQLSSAFQSITGYYTEDISETSGSQPEKLTRAWVAPRFFETWGIYPGLGRSFTPQEERFGGPNAVVVSDRFWRRRFGSARTVLPQQLRLEKVPFTIVGVMPAGFLFPDRKVDLWAPSAVDAPYAQSRESTWFTAIGRLKLGASIDQARADLSTIQTHLGEQYPKTDRELEVRIRPLKEVTLAGAGHSLWILFASVSLLLLIACINIAALLLARTADREHEISIRLSLGASRASIMTRLFAEVLLLALAGSALGLVLATSAAGVFHALAKSLPRVEEIRLNWTLVFYSLICAVGATFLCGLLPAIRSMRKAVAGSLAHAGRTQVSSRSPLQWTLVGVQVALSVTLLFGAGLLLRSFQELGRVSPGFEPTRVLTFRISANWAETTDLNLLWRRVDNILDNLRTLPGIEAASTALAVPGVAFQHPGEMRIVEGDTDPNRKIIAYSRVVSSGYFATLQIPVLAGESCRDAELTTVLVNRSFADTYLSGSLGLGRHIENVPANRYIGPAEIRGVVADAREEGLNREPAPTVYWCNSAANPSPVFLVRTFAEPMAMAATIRAKIHEIEPSRSVYDVMPLRDHLDETFSENRLRTILLTFFALAAVSLACLGIYGTLSYFVNMRRREVGLRIALGAMRAEIVSHFVLLGMRVCILGCVAGLGLAAVLGRTLSGLLYGVSSSDPITFGSVLLLVLATGAVSSLIPAIRAARVQPMQVLRDD